MIWQGIAALIPGVNVNQRKFPSLTRRQLRLAGTAILVVGLIYFFSRPFTPRFRADLHFGRGFWYFRQAEYDSAIDEFTQAIDLRPTHGAALVNRGHAYAVQGDDQAALADYDAVIAAYPDVPDSYLDRGRVYAHLGDTEAALADFTHALELRPYLAVAFYDRGQVYESMGDESAALADYRQFLDLYGLEDDLTQSARARVEALTGTP